MATVERPSGVRVTFPETMALTDAAPPRGTTRSFREFAPPSGPSPFAEELVRSLGEMELDLLDEIPLHTLAEPSDQVRGRSRSAQAIPPNQAIDFDVEIGTGERAVALIEQDGIYSWSFGDVIEMTTGQATRGLRNGAAPGATVRFTVPIHASSSAQRRTRLFGMERVFRPITAFIFKFPARFLIGQVVQHLEKDIDERVVHFTGPKTSDWKEISDLATLQLPDNRPPRILLMIHGTFSSTAGAFGALGVTDFGQMFMSQAIDSYDAVLGFDHRTLSIDPLENASHILAGLERLESAHPIVFDAVAHSRGGLVVRSLVEHLLPASDLNASMRSAVFVASTNAGTALASSENWHRLIDMYTNLAIGAINGLSVVAPPTAATNAILGGLIKGAAVFVKALACTALDENQVLGLAAMSPTGSFVSEINKTQPGQPTPDAVDYYAITSDFEPSLADDTALPAKLLRALADGAVDQLMGEANDLVVDVDSMTSIDPHRDGFVKDVLDFGSNGLVHHTSYFHHEGTGKALGRWLRITDPTAALLGGVPERRGGLVAGDLPPYVEDDVIVVPSQATGRQLADLLDAGTPEFVIVRRRDASTGEVYHYGFRPDELTAATPDEYLEDALMLGERVSSPTVSATAVTAYESGSVSSDHPQMSRSVAMRGRQPVGVVPHKDEMRTAAASRTTAFRTPPPVWAAATHAPGGRRGGGVIGAPHTTSGGVEMSQPQRVRHYFSAQMPHEVVIDEVASVEVTVSMKDLAMAASRAAGIDSAEVDTDRPIVLDVRPRRGFEIVEEGRAEIDPLQPGHPDRTLFFDVRATDQGPGEVDVVVRQGQVPLVTLQLEPVIVAAQSGGVRHQVSAEALIADAPRLKEPINELTIWEQMSHGETRLHFLFRAPGLNVRESAYSNPIESGLEKYVAGIYKNIEERWTARRHTPDTFTKDLQAIGMGMFQSLVPDKIQKLLWEHRKELTGIQVLSDEPFVPWEIVHLKGRGETTREEWFLGQMGLVRWLENLENNGFGPEHLEVHKALAIIPNYPAGTDWELKEPAEEFSYLEQKLGAEKVPSTRISVDEILENPGSFDLLHYAGHGEALAEGAIDASLILGVEAGDGRWLTEALDSETVAQFANLATNGHRPMVVLNACQVGRMRRRLGGTGGFAKAFLSRGAGVFVSSLWAVGDEPARQFVETLYDKLHSGDMVSQAVSKSRRSARESGDFTWLAYTVYANPHATVSFA